MTARAAAARRATGARHPYAVVRLAALDLRRRPDHRSELLSQLLMGEVVRVEGMDRTGGWWRIRTDGDGYRGWSRSWGLIGTSAARARVWERRASGRVEVTHAEARNEVDGAVLSPLFWRGRVILARRRGALRLVELPDGRKGWVSAASVVPARQRPMSMLRRLRSLMGVPYLWGGRTSCGLDCSALTQLVLGEQGVPIARDAHDQFRSSRRLRTGEAPREGDLVFFSVRPHSRVGHVGLCLGGGYFVHCRGWVRVASVQPGNPLFERDLFPQLRGFGRPKAAERRRPRRSRLRA